MLLLLNLKIPLLQVRIGNKTISGVGTWEGVYFSEELKIALTMGYTIEIISGRLIVNRFSEILLIGRIHRKGGLRKLYNMRIAPPARCNRFIKR
jgi:hypothetical protein